MKLVRLFEGEQWMHQSNIQYFAPQQRLLILKNSVFNIRGQVELALKYFSSGCHCLPLKLDVQSIADNINNHPRKCIKGKVTE